MKDEAAPKSRRESRRSRSRKRTRAVLISIAAFITVLLVGAGAYVWSLSQTLEGSEKIQDAFPEESKRPTVKVVDGKPPPINILLLGSDSLDGSTDIQGSRSDTMMLVHIPSDRKSIQVMSFMRDLWVEIPGNGEAKLNAATAVGGIPLLVETLEGMTGVRIDHVAMVNFDGFKGITDVLGGVTVNNPEDFYGQGHYFAEGPITLDGERALVYVRERMAFRDGDYTRVRNQQVFIKALMGRVLSAETLTNPVTIHNLVGAVAPYVAMDSGLNAARLAGLGFELRDVRVGDVSFMTVPTTGTGRVGNQSVVFMDWDGFAVLVEALQADELDQYTPQPSPYD